MEKENKLLKKRICDSLEKLDKNVYRILDTPNFFFPIMDIGKKFTIVDSLTVELKDAKLIKEYRQLRDIDIKHNRWLSDMNQKIISSIFWNTIRENKIDEEYPDCWIVPINLCFLGDDCLEITVDVLKPVEENE